MSKMSTNKVHSTKVLATKKASSSQEKSTPLSFRQVTEGELQKSRNTAYSYLVK